MPEGPLPDSTEPPLFRDEDPPAAATEERAWRVLIIDDEPEVHRATRFALGDVRFQGRPLEFLNAYSAAEGRRVLQQQDDIALVFLDVVMEDDHAGLELVRSIREEIGNRDVRIVLRTGYPGLAPGYQVIADYDINDYRVKTELSAERLYATTLAALRAYRDLMIVHRSEEGLRFIVDTVPLLLRDRERRRFAENMLQQLARALDVAPHGAVIEGTDPPRLLAVAGIDAAPGEALDSQGSGMPVSAIRRSLERGLGDDGNGDLFVHIGSGEHEAPAVIWLHVGRPLESVERQLLQVFGMNLGVALDNLSLYERTRQLAYFDTLTGLGNRALFAQQLEAMIQRSTTPAESLNLQIAMVNIVRFREFNSVLGRAAGDRLLVALGQRLVEHFPEAHAAGRISGDTFVLLLPADTPPERLFQATADPFDIVDTPLRLEISAGLTRYPEDGTDAETLLRNADVALGLARRDHPGEIATYSRSIDEGLARRLNLLQDLRGAVERDELMPWFQPQIDLATGETVGAEVLLRWRRQGELVSPAEFIPIAESSGLIRPIGERVLELALEYQRALARRYDRPCRLSVNLSAMQLADEEFPARLRRLLGRHEPLEAPLEMEITETVLMEDVESSMTSLDALRELGLELAIDDFGTGYSSLAYLRRVRPDRLKIDRAFITPLETSEDARSITRAIIELGHHLGMRVIAEGVETPAQRDLLLSMGCDEGQGFLWAPALPADEFSSWQARPAGGDAG